MHSKALWFAAFAIISIPNTSQTAALAQSCEGVARVDTTSVTRDEGTMISACEYRDDCQIAKGTKLSVNAIVVLPLYDMHHMFIMDESRRCFFSADFEYTEECNAPVRVNEGCES